MLSTREVFIGRVSDSCSDPRTEHEHARNGDAFRGKDYKGQYRELPGQLTPDMAGDWSVDLSYQGPQGPAKVTVPVNVKQ